jgi:ribose transport system substrate-binding protein
MYSLRTIALSHRRHPGFSKSGQLLIVLLASWLAASGVSSGADATPAANGKTLTIAFMRPGPDPYYQDGQNGAVMAAPSLGAKVVTYFSNDSQSQELANVEDAISKKVDGILMYAVSLSAESADVAKANAANVPIFLLYGYDKNLLPKVAGFEQVDLIHYGKEVGTWLTKHLDAGKVAIITGLLGRGDAEAYAQGFKEGLADNKQLTVVAQVPGDWNRQKAQHAAQDLITAHPDLKALYIENEDMAIGAILALKRAGKLSQVMVVSCNGAPYGLEAISNGEIQASNTCSPALEAVMGLRVLTGVIGHTTEPSHLYYSLTVFVTKDNVKDANPWVPDESGIQKFLSLPLLTPVADSDLP